MRKIVWFVERLRAMSLSEIVHRVEEKAKRDISVSRQGWERFGKQVTTLPGFPEEVFDLKTPFSDNELRRWQVVYEDARAGRFRYLGKSWPEAAGMQRFTLDPVSGNDWPNNAYCYKIPYRHSENYGDVKYVWEVNRLQYLQPIAMLAKATSDEGAARFCIDELLLWCDGNPPFKGVAWASGIELALRVLTILFVVPLVRTSIGGAEATRLIKCLDAHLFWLYRYPSRFSSANNHLVAEAAALGVAGVLWPEHPRSHEYREYGRRTLEVEVLAQLHSDGVGAEQSPTYTAFTVEFLLLAMRIFAAAGQPLAPSVGERVGRTVEHWLWLMDEAGGVPRIGDDDEGRVIHDSMGGECGYVAAIACAAAATLSRPDLTPPGANSHLRDRVFGRASGMPVCPTGARTFAEGGYTVLRDRVAGRMVVVTFDHAPLGYLSIAAHGHADALAVWMSVGAQQVLIDAGTFGYHGANEARDMMRGTAAHNTVTVNGTDQSQITGPFNWRNHAKATLVSAVDPCAPVWTVTARHDGYAKSFGVTHERTITWDRATAMLIIEDTLTGGTCEATARLLFAPGCTLAADVAEASVTWEGGTLEIAASGVSTIKVEPRDTSPAFGEREATSGLSLPFKERLTTRLRMAIGDHDQ